MDNIKLSLPMVGMHYRGVWAKELVSNLALGTKMLLEREPDNSYDPNAVKVLTTIGALAQEDRDLLESFVESSGLDFDMQDEEELIFLGYVMANPPKKNYSGERRNFAQEVARIFDSGNYQDPICKFSRLPDGFPLVIAEFIPNP